MNKEKVEDRVNGDITKRRRYENVVTYMSKAMVFNALFPQEERDKTVNETEQNDVVNEASTESLNTQQHQLNIIKSNLTTQFEKSLKDILNDLKDEALQKGIEVAFNDYIKRACESKTNLEAAGKKIEKKTRDEDLKDRTEEMKMALLEIKKSVLDALLPLLQMEKDVKTSQVEVQSPKPGNAIEGVQQLERGEVKNSKTDAMRVKEVQELEMDFCRSCDQDELLWDEKSSRIEHLRTELNVLKQSEKLLAAPLPDQMIGTPLLEKSQKYLQEKRSLLEFAIKEKEKTIEREEINFATGLFIFSIVYIFIFLKHRRCAFYNVGSVIISAKIELLDRLTILILANNENIGNIYMTRIHHL